MFLISLVKKLPKIIITQFRIIRIKSLKKKMTFFRSRPLPAISGIKEVKLAFQKIIQQISLISLLSSNLKILLPPPKFRLFNLISKWFKKTYNCLKRILFKISEINNLMQVLSMVDWKKFPLKWRVQKMNCYNNWK